MKKYQTWDVVVVPFPFTDQQTTKVRPAVVVSTATMPAKTGKYLLAMITNAQNAAQYGDVRITDLATAGLPTSSVVRPSKLAIFESGDIRRRVGQLPSAERIHIAHALREFIAQS
jgi:mRNA interferase MazF